jgi:heme exporter protein A
MTMLETHRLECVRGSRRLFKDLTFLIRPGDCFRLTGPNGSGKTSLLRMLCGLLPPTSGEILWQGANISALGTEYFLSVTYLGHRHAVKDGFTALENLRVSCGLSGSELSREQALDVLGRMGLGGRENLQTRLLSEGQRRRLALARLLVCRTPLWLLDEVLTSLDDAAAESFNSLLEAHLSRGGMAIIATHQELKLRSGIFQRIELAS